MQYSRSLSFPLPVKTTEFAPTCLAAGRKGFNSIGLCSVKIGAGAGLASGRRAASRIVPVNASHRCPPGKPSPSGRSIGLPATIHSKAAKRGARPPRRPSRAPRACRHHAALRDQPENMGWLRGGRRDPMRTSATISLFPGTLNSLPASSPVPVWKRRARIVSGL